MSEEPGAKPAGTGRLNSAGELTLLDYGRVFWKGRSAILAAALTAGALAVGISLLVPPTYEAVTTLIPASPRERFPLFGQLGTSLEDLGVSAPLSNQSTAMYPEIVRSRRLLEELLSMQVRLNAGESPIPLIDVVQRRGSGRRRIDLALRRMRRMVDATVDRRSGVLTIRVRTRFPQVAADVANAMGGLLQTFIVHSLASQAGENRRFIEGRLSDTQVSLAYAEEQLKIFRERNLRIGNAPHLLLEEGRLTRALREQEEIYLTLRRQYELAKIEEHRDVPAITVLDPAEAPTFRRSPQRSMAGILGAFFGATLCFGVLLVGRRFP